MHNNAALFGTIKSLYPSFTKSEKKIADYALTNAKKMVYMTITEIAVACKVSDTSVFRFCRRLGTSGFQAFKIALTQAVSDSNHTPELSSCVVAPGDCFEVMVEKVLNSSLSILNETYRLLDLSSLATATQWLTTAEHVCFFGTGPCSVSALSAQNHLLLLGPKAEYLPDPRMQLVRATTLTPKDVAIFISYTGKAKEMIAIGEAVKKSGAKSICISRYSRSPLVELSNLTLLCAGTEGPCQSGILNMKMAILFLIETLCVAYCQANAAEARTTRTLADALAIIGI